MPVNTNSKTSSPLSYAAKAKTYSTCHEKKIKQLKRKQDYLSMKLKQQIKQ